MPCIAEGNPPPVITWYKNGNSFLLNHRIFTDDAGTLRINDLVQEDAGLFECVASSRSGKYVWRAHLHVDVSSNPSSVFRRTGFDMATLRPREPMKPHVVKVDATTVTIAWNPKHFQSTSDQPSPSESFLPWSEMASNSRAESQSPPRPSFIQRKVKSSKRSRNGAESEEEDYDDDDLMVDDPPPHDRNDGHRAWVKRDIAFETNDYLRPRTHSLQHPAQLDTQSQNERDEVDFNAAYIEGADDSEEIGDESEEEYKEDKSPSDKVDGDEDLTSGGDVYANQAHHGSFISSRQNNDNNLIIQSTRTSSSKVDAIGNMRNEPIPPSTIPTTTRANTQPWVFTTATTTPTTTTTSTTIPTTTTKVPQVPENPPSEKGNNNNVVSNGNPNNNNNPKPLTYKVEYYSAEEVRTEWLLGATNVPSEIFTLHYLKPNTEYIFMVRSVSPDGLVSAPSPFSESVTTSMTGSKNSQIDMATASEQLKSAIVVILRQAYATSSTSIRIEWQIVNAGAYIEGFYIYFRQLGQKDEGSYQMLTVLNAGASSFQIVGLEKYATYQIFLLPFYKTVDGRPSNYVNVSTLQD
ncbi:unnamed protein product, partial [Allacma fusca]